MKNKCFSMDNKICISFLDMIFATQLLQQAKNSRQQMDYNLSQRMNNYCIITI